VRSRWGHAAVAVAVLLSGVAATLFLAAHEQRSLTVAANDTFEMGAGQLSG